MYRRPKFLETLIEIRKAMAHDADYDVDLFAEMARSGRSSVKAGSTRGSGPGRKSPGASGSKGRKRTQE